MKQHNNNGIKKDPKRSRKWNSHWFNKKSVLVAGWELNYDRPLAGQSCLCNCDASVSGNRFLSTCPDQATQTGYKPETGAEDDEMPNHKGIAWESKDARQWNVRSGTNKCKTFANLNKSQSEQVRLIEY
ncbi:hypothetical protein T06_12134 [Trichinella sp. T6]|nr:hypothetical protein T06_12134 [Trichinella sp. T6]